jgi:tRNA(fMet)-specific endonuclease VapC
VKQYLLDTNICIYYIKGLYELDRKIETAGQRNCFISEITVAELKYGVYDKLHLMQRMVYCREKGSFVS